MLYVYRRVVCKLLVVFLLNQILFCPSGGNKLRVPARYLDACGVSLTEVYVSCSFPVFENPYPMDVHESPVTCTAYFADCPPDIIPILYSIGAKHKKTGYSQKVGGRGICRLLLWPLLPPSDKSFYSPSYLMERNRSERVRWEKEKKKTCRVVRIISAFCVTMSGVACQRRNMDLRLTHVPRNYHHRVSPKSDTKKK